MEFSVADRKSLKEQIEKNFNKDEYKELFKIIRDDQAKYTENRNGIHIVFNFLSNETLTKIKQFVDFSIDNQNRLEEQERIYNDERQKIESSKCNQTVVEQNFDFPEFRAEYNDCLDKNIFEETACSESDFSEDEVSENVNVTMKQHKHKFTGVRAKLLKSYKDVNRPANTVTSKHKGKEKDTVNADSDCSDEENDIECAEATL